MNKSSIVYFRFATILGDCDCEREGAGTLPSRRLARRRPTAAGAETAPGQPARTPALRSREPWQRRDGSRTDPSFDRKSIEVDQKLIPFDRKSINVDKESIDVDRKSIDVDQESIDVDKESITVDQRSIDVDQESINVDRKSFDVDRKSIDVDSTFDRR